jgi:CRP-like cAMP-binding protein
MHQKHNPMHFNKLLASLSQQELEALEPSLEWTELPMQQVLYSSHQPIEFAYFPTSGICSVIAENETGTQSETGLIGRDGFVGIPIIHYVDSAPLKIIVQAGGRGLKISRDKLLEAISNNQRFHIILLQYAHVFAVQVSQTALSNGHFKINQRLARWLLMCHDRVDANEFPMTHKFLSVMLAVRRASITEALSYLESKNAIRALRGRIVVLNRTLLEEIAEGAYGVSEKEYERLLKQT